MINLFGAQFTNHLRAYWQQVGWLDIVLIGRSCTRWLLRSFCSTLVNFLKCSSEQWKVALVSSLARFFMFYQVECAFLFINFIWRLWRNRCGQSVIEQALRYVSIRHCLKLLLLLLRRWGLLHWHEHVGAVLNRNVLIIWAQTYPKSFLDVL